MDIFHAGLYGYLLLILLLLVSFSVSYLFYRNTEVKDFKKAALLILRTASLFLILSLLLSPFFLTRSDSVRQPTDIILVDNSLSLNIEKRYEKLSSALDDMRKLSSNYRVYAFGSGLLNEITGGKELFTGSEYRTYSTDLAAAFEELSRISSNTGINSVTVISDGIITEKENLTASAKKLNAPVYYYIVGDTVQKKDVLIRNLFYNRNAPAGSTATVRALVHSYGYSGNININLYEEGILKQTKNILVNNSESEYSAEFRFASGIPGIKKFSIRIDTLANEITALNNDRDFYIKFTDNRFRILVIAGSPGADFAAFRQAVSGFGNINADFLTGKSPDTFYEGGAPPLKGYDALFLFGYPLANTDRNTAGKIAADADANNIPVVFFNTSNTGYENLKVFEKLLPFSVAGGSGNSYASPCGMLPFSAPEEPEPIRKISKLPPAYFSRGAFLPRPGSSVLGVTSVENEPAILLYNSGNFKSAAFLGFGVYKWTLNSSRDSENLLKDLTAVLFNLVMDGNRRNKFYLYTDKDCYALSEPVSITAIDGTDTKGGTTALLKISGKNFSREQEMDRNDASSFRYVFTPDSANDYTANGLLFADRQILAEDAIRFSCGNNRDEYIITRPNPSVLKNLALNTGGTDIKEYKEPKFPKKELPDRNETIANKFLLRENVYMLILIILLLSTEWFLRKRFNLP